MKRLLLVATFLFTTTMAAEAASPYAGQQDREIKALSRAEIEGYLNGKGMGLAKAAELNGYPGPKHVLELAIELELTAGQRERTQAIFDRMHAEAVRLGGAVVAAERGLDRAFAGGTADGAALRAMVDEIGSLRARLRFTHLAAHLEQRAVMSEHQIRVYRELRGYGEGRGRHHGRD